MFKTIAETAKELNVTRQCVYKKLSTLRKELENCVTVDNGVKLISHKGIEIIKNDLNNSSFTVSKNVNSNKVDQSEIKENVATNSNEFKYLHDPLVNSLYESRIKQLEDTIEYLKMENETKNKQLDNKDKQLDNKDKLLENMQVLLKDQSLLLESKESKGSKKKWWFFKD